MDAAYATERLTPADTVAPAVAYAAKSTEDHHGSIPTQLADCEALADRDGYDVVASFEDVASGYTGSRGSDLAAAVAKAETLAREHGKAALIVQHSDRLARGDGVRAKHLVEYALWALKANVKVLSVQDPQTFSDLLYAVVTGQRNHEDSKRKSQATAAGQRRRFESGRRLGSPIPDGYRLEPVLGGDGNPMIGRDGRAVRDVALDPNRAPIWRRIFDMVEQGHTFGHIRETLNGEGLRTGRGGPWTTRTIRRGVRSGWYAGRAGAYGQTIEDDHEPLIEPGRWERIAASVRSDDPVSARARAGGRPATDNADDYLLRGIVTCGRCGSSLYTRRLAAGRHYICRAVREGHGCCDAPYIPAERAEKAVLFHLDSFVANLEDWLADKVRQADAERQGFGDALDAQRRELARSARRIEGAQAVYERAVDAGNADRADVALDELVRLKRERADHGDRLAEAELRLAEWPSPPEVDQALDLYSRLRDAVQGRVVAADSVRELNATLRAAVGAALLDTDGVSMFGWFQLRLTDEVTAGRLPHTLGVVDSDSGGSYYKWWCSAPNIDRDEVERYRRRTGLERLQDSKANMPAGWRLRERAELNTTRS